MLDDQGGAFAADLGFDERVFRVVAPSPGVAQPEHGEDVEGGGFRAVVGHRQAPKQIFRGAFGHLLEHVEVTAFVEEAHVGEFLFRAEPAKPLVFLAQRRVGIPGVGIFVEGLGVGMGGGGIEVVITLLYVLPVVALKAVEPEEALLQNRVLPVP